MGCSVSAQAQNGVTGRASEKGWLVVLSRSKNSTSGLFICSSRACAKECTDAVQEEKKGEHDPALEEAGKEVEGAAPTLLRARYQGSTEPEPHARTG